MPNVGRIVGLVLAVAMFIFSVWMYSRTGDWVAILFAIGSAAYTMFFFSSASGKKPS
jgi:Mg/Co/Ni transporter MgtE